MRTLNARQHFFLFLADIATLGSAFFFATDALSRPEALKYAPLILLWAVIPHFVSWRIRLLGWPKVSWVAGIAGLMFSTLVLAGGFVGFELITTQSDGVQPVFVGTAALGLLLWGTAFLLFMSPIYRMHDFLAGGVMLMGMLERREHPIYFLPLFLFGLCASAFLRHRLLDRHPKSDSGERMAFGLGRCLVFVGSTSALFIALVFALHPLIDEDKLAEDADPVRGLENLDPNQENRSSDAIDGTAASAREIGFPELMRLADIEEARGNATIVVRIRPKDAPSSAPTLTNRLWRVVAFESFSFDRLEWNSFERPFDRRRWTQRGIRRRPSMSDLGAAAEFSFEIENLVFRNYALPYEWSWFRSNDTLDDESRIFVDGVGSYVPRQPALRMGSRYSVRFPPHHRPGLTVPDDATRPRRIDPVDLMIPADDQVGFPLRALASKVFGDARSLPDKVAALSDWYRNNIRYDLTLDWLPQDRRERLAKFAVEARRGDCMYFATLAALLLRAHGVAARFVAGYGGADWDANDKSWVVRQSHAHAWIEVQSGNKGWIPLDPVSWTPSGAARGPLLALTEEEEWQRRGLDLKVFPDIALIGVAGLIVLLLLARAWSRSRDPELQLAQASFAVPRVAIAALPKGSIEAQILRDYEKVQGRLARRGLQRAAHETPQEQCARIKVLHPEASEPLSYFEQLLDEVFFGGRAAQTEDAERARRALKTIRRIFDVRSRVSKQ